ncbi:MAG: hypothetical protein KBS98_01320 [Flavobacterium sp.]|nr:hypothetical protein [Candidatus Neoflavobacterium equi]
MTIKNKIILALLCIGFLFNVTTMFAQVQTESNVPPPPDASSAAKVGPAPYPGLPIDSSLYVLVIMGLAVGCYFVNKKEIKG